LPCRRRMVNISWPNVAAVGDAVATGTVMMINVPIAATMMATGPDQGAGDRVFQVALAVMIRVISPNILNALRVPPSESETDRSTISSTICFLGPIGAVRAFPVDQVATIQVTFWNTLNARPNVKPALGCQAVGWPPRAKF